MNRHLCGCHFATYLGAILVCVSSGPFSLIRSLFVPKNSVHIPFRQEGVVVEACVLSLDRSSCILDTDLCSNSIASLVPVIVAPLGEA
jgi:hypothetical protein